MNWLVDEFSKVNQSQMRCPRGIMAKVMDCGIELQLHYYGDFRANTIGKGMNPLILPDMG